VSATSAAPFRELARCGRARAGDLSVRGRTLATPAFMPVATYGSVKGVAPHQLRDVGTRIVVANACHLHDRPGAGVVRDLGGLHRFMNWDGLVLTDSGGFQVFSMLDIAQVHEDGVRFRSPVDGRPLQLGPREAVEAQLDLDSDITMAFDHCPPLPAPPELLEQSVRRTTRWARIAREHHARKAVRGQALFGIVQGGLDDRLRERSAGDLVPLDFDGYAIGGLSVGEPSAALQAALGRYAGLLPEQRVRYVMGIGRPQDVLVAIASGFDIFDSVFPTRNGRHGTVFTPHGTLNLRNTRLRTEPGPIEAGCDCPACSNWSVGALRHLLVAADPLARTLCALHNLRFMHRLVAAAREAIVEASFDAFLARHVEAASAPGAQRGV
jgi:queuine tRNA-ribosyltransferase